MLSEAKDLSLFPADSIQKKSEIFRFAQNDIGRWVMVWVKFIEEKKSANPREIRAH